MSNNAGPQRSDGISASLQEQINRYLELAESGADRSTLRKMENDMAKQLASRFKTLPQLPKFLRAAAQARRARFQIRLASNKREIPDNRERKHPVSRHKSPRARRAEGQKQPNLEQMAAGSRTKEMISKFEQKIIARFQNGAEIEVKHPDGHPKFGDKTSAEWKNFFATLAHRTVPKKISMEEIRQMIFRGILSGSGKGAVIADMLSNAGRLEKFIRFQILSNMAALLGKFRPGDKIPKELLSQLSGEELVYLALAARRGREYKTGDKPAEGKFMMGGVSEERAAQDLGIALESQLREKARHLRGKKGFMGGLFGSDEEEDDVPKRFVPWWQWGDLDRPGKWKFVRTIFYIALFAVSLIGIGVMTIRLLAG